MVGKREERLVAAYDYLKSKGMAHKQQDIAEAMNTNKSNISHALNGDQRFLTDSFLRRFNAAYGNIFNDKWLVEGTGEMLKSNFSLSVGNHSPNAGFGNTANANTEAFIAEIAAQRGLTEAAQRQTAKAQEQIDRLLGIIEGMQK